MRGQRMRSKRRDSNDRAAMTEATVAASYPNTFFWSQLGRPIYLNDLYAGSTAFLIAGGPSFGELSAEMRTRIGYCWTMALNNAIHSCRKEFRPRAWCCVDDPGKFVKSTYDDPAVLKCIPWRWHGKISGPGTVYYRRNEAFDPDRYLFEDTVNWGCSDKRADLNGDKGGRSVLLAALKILYVLGFRRVYLLGVDFAMNRRQPYSFSEKLKRSEIVANLTTYQILNRRFDALRPRFDAAEFRVYNCNNASRCRSFEFAELETVIDLDGLISEKTEGLYRRA
jgi:hypothetical protein